MYTSWDITRVVSHDNDLLLVSFLAEDNDILGVIPDDPLFHY